SPHGPPSAHTRSPHGSLTVRVAHSRQSYRREWGTPCTPQPSQNRARRNPPRPFCVQPRSDRSPPPVQPCIQRALVLDTPADGCAQTPPRPPPPRAASHRHRLRSPMNPSNLEPCTSHLLNRRLNRLPAPRIQRQQLGHLVLALCSACRAKARRSTRLYAHVRLRRHKLQQIQRNVRVAPLPIHHIAHLVSILIARSASTRWYRSSEFRVPQFTGSGSPQETDN